MLYNRGCISVVLFYDVDVMFREIRVWWISYILYNQMRYMYFALGGRLFVILSLNDEKSCFVTLRAGLVAFHGSLVA